jgi:hypothetical protein
MFRSHCVLRLIVGAVITISGAMTAGATCSAPVQSGLALCFPSQGSTVLYPPTIEFGVNSGGVAVSHLSVYDGNVRIDDLGFVPGQLIDFSLKNGLHHITANVWDANGKLYQAKSSFTVTGFGAGSCALQSGAINLCWPAAGSYQPENSAFSVAFGTAVKSWGVTLDGKAVINSGEVGPPSSGPVLTAVYASAGSHTLIVRALDAKGVATSVTRQFFTFYDLNCNPRTGACSPGITIIHPSQMGEDIAGDEGTSFQMQAEVAGNQKPTTKMIVYLDGVKVEQSSGPGITAAVSTSKGSHYLVVQAWDTAGKMYETYGNVNVQ